MPVDLVGKIKKTSKRQKTFLIAIDGFGGSGKSTVAKFLKENLENVTVVEMDDFYSSELKRADFERVSEQVLKPLINDNVTRYQRYDWKSGSLMEWHTIEPGGIVIVEGVYAMHKDFQDAYDFKIWVDCQQEVGFKRGVERDKVRDGIDNSDKWVQDWMPLEKEYVQSQNPQQNVDYIIKFTP